MSMPLQTQSKWSHIRGWGCYASTLLSFLDIDMTVDDVEAVIRAAAAFGIIKDNAAPINNADPNSWWRCFVTNAPKFIEFAGRYFGNSVQAVAMLNTKKPMKNSHASHVAIEYETSTGSHFIRGGENPYNPDPSVKIGSVKSYRYFEVKRD